MKGLRSEIDAEIRQKIKQLVKTEEKLNKYQMQLTSVQERIKILQQNRLSFVKALKDFDNNRTRQTLENLCHYFDKEDLIAKKKLDKLQNLFHYITSMGEQSARRHEDLAQLLSAQTVIGGYIQRIHKVFYDFKIVYFNREIHNQIYPEPMTHHLNDEITAYVQDGEPLLETLETIKPVRNVEQNKRAQGYWKYYKRGKLILHAIDENIKLLQKKIRFAEDTAEYHFVMDQMDEALIELDELYIENIYEYQNVLFRIRKDSIQETTRKNQICVEIHGLIGTKNIVQEYMDTSFQADFLCLEVLEDSSLQELILNLEVLLLQTDLAFVLVMEKDKALAQKLETAIQKVIEEENLSIVYFCRSYGNPDDIALPKSWIDGVNVLEYLEEEQPAGNIEAFLKNYNRPFCTEQSRKEVRSYTKGLLKVTECMGDVDSVLMDYVIQCIIMENYQALYIIACVLAERQRNSEILYLIVQTLLVNNAFFRELQYVLEKIRGFDGDLYQICFEMHAVHAQHSVSDAI